MRHETLRRQLALPQIAQRQTFAAHQQFAHRPARLRRRLASMI
jgi:hypothetical protein